MRLVGLLAARLDRSQRSTGARYDRDVLTEHVLFEVDCVDRMYCNVYVPQLQYAAGLVGYVQGHEWEGLQALLKPVSQVRILPGALVSDVT